MNKTSIAVKVIKKSVFTAIFLSLLSVFTANTVSANVINVDKMKGLQRNPKADKIEDGSHTTFDNMYKLDSNLTMVKGRDRINSAAHADTTVNGFYYYERPSVVGTCDNCELLLHMDDLVATTTFVDGSPVPHAITTNGNTIQNTNALKFGTAGAEFDGTGDYLSIPDSPDWFFGASDFTIDFWYVRLSGASQSIASQFQDSNNYWELYSNGVTQVVFRVVSGGTTIINATWTDTGFAASQVHYELVRQGNRFYMFRNGVEMTIYGASGGTTDSDAIPDFTGALRIGRSVSVADAFGRMDEFRIEKGQAANIVDFTPSTVPYDLGGPASQNLVIAESNNLVTYNLNGTNRTVIAPSTSNVQWSFTQIGPMLYATNTIDGIYKWNGTGIATKQSGVPAFPYIEEYKGSIFIAEDRNLRYSNDVGELLTDAETYNVSDHILVGVNQYTVTGLKKTYDGLLIFTEGSVQELTGFGADSFRLRSLVIGVGAISNRTIEPDKNGDVIFFAGILGVYKLNVGTALIDDSTNTRIDKRDSQLTKISPSLDTVFKGIDTQIDLNPNDYINSHAYYDTELDLYFLYIGEHCFIYDNKNAIWTHVPATQMRASLYAYSVSNLLGQGMLIDDLGFLYNNWKGYETATGGGTVTGIPTTGTSTTLVDSGASFYNADSGLIGIWVMVDHGVDIEYRRITDNDGTSLTVSPAFATAPSNNDTYYIGYIRCDMVTKQYAFAPMPDEGLVTKLFIDHNKAVTTQEMFITSYQDKTEDIKNEFSIDLSLKFIDVINIRMRGRWLQWEFKSMVYNTSDTIDSPIDINSYHVDVEQKERIN